MVLRTAARRGPVLLVLWCVTMLASAELQLHGAAEFTELRRSFYLAGLQAGEPFEDSEALLAGSAPLRMTLKVTVDRWTTRSFSNHWSRALLINNDPALLDAFGEAVIEFSSLPRDDLLRGDELVVERLEDGSTEVWLNGHSMMTVAKPGFAELLLRTWVGPRPPSTGFRQQILGEADSAQERALLLALAPSEERIEAVGLWLEDDGEPASETAPEQADQAVAGQGDMDGAERQREPSSRSRVAEQAAAASPQARERGPGERVESAREAAPPDSSQARARRVAAAEPGVESREAVEASPARQSEAREAPEEAEATEDEEVATLSVEEEQALLQLYQNMVVRRILGAVEYPDYALRRGLEGVVQLRIQVNRAGQILDVEQRQGARYSVLNDAARKAVERTRVFPRVPEAMPGELINVDVPIRFQLQ